jgi:hypothetical protein
MILIARFQHTWRERMPEWALAFGMAAFGAILLLSPGLFDRPFYHPMAHLAPQRAWGGVTLAVGMLRIVCLVRNGGWRPSAHLRAAGCFVGVLVWEQLLVCALSVDWLSGGIMWPAAFLFLDAWSFYFAVGDAKSADRAARDMKRAVADGGR